MQPNRLIPMLKKNPIHPKIVECVNCKILINSNKRYCSDNCRVEFIRKQRIEKGLIKMYSKICRNCNCSFTTSVAHAVFCNKNCKKMYLKSEKYKIQNRKYQSNTTFFKLRFEIFKRDNFTCKYCGRNVIRDGITLNVEHIIPRKLGGLTITDNLITSCLECNLGKKDTLLEIHQIDKLKEYIKNSINEPTIDSTQSGGHL